MRLWRTIDDDRKLTPPPPRAGVTRVVGGWGPERAGPAPPAAGPTATNSLIRQSGRRAWLIPLVIVVGLVLLALPPRLLDTDRFVTTDELFWLGRSAAFARAVQTGRFADTFQSGHPGVTTMWTAWLGMGNAFAADLAPSRREVSRREVSQSPSFMPALAAARRGFGVVTAVGVGLAGFLAWRLFGAWPAILGGTLLALDPFMLAHSRLVHIDASLALWTSLGLLAALVRWSGGGWWSLVFAGVATGLALLSKAPSLILLPLVPFALVVMRGPGVLRDPRAWRDLAIWALLTAVVYITVWPAFWVAPVDTLGRVLAFARDNANPAHAAAADEDGIGIWFYLLVLLFRSTPLSWLGLLGLAINCPRGMAGRAAIVLMLYAVGFAAAMTIAAKNFDRYLLPVFPTLDLLAGLGLWRLCSLSRWERVGVRECPPSPSRWGGGRGVGPSWTVRAGLILTVLTLSAWWLAAAWPYELTYANPLLGGNPAAHRTIASGWGEGLDQVAAYLNQRPNAARLKAAMPGEIYTTVLDAQLRGTVAPAEGADAGAYDAFVVYLRNRQLGERPPFFDEELLAWQPERTIVLDGVEYAWVYDTRNGAPLGAEFGDLVRLDGYGLDSATPRVGRPLTLKLHWQPLRALPPGLQLQVELRPDSASQTYTVALPLPNNVGDPAAPPGERAVGTYQVPIPADLPPGSYVLAVRLLGADSRPLPITAQPTRPPGVPNEPDAIPLRHLQLR